MLIALETATSVCSVALWNEDGCIAETSLLRPRKHAEMLVPMVRDLLRTAEVEIREIGAVAVSKGPGSYTGLRIGASTAKGLAWAAGAKLVGAPSLEALAYGAAGQAAPGDVVAAAFPSRREDVYLAVFRVEEWRDGGVDEWKNGGMYGIARVMDDAALPVEEAAKRVIEYRAERLWVIGEGGARLAPFLTKNARHLPPSTHHASAALVARLGWERLQEGRVEDLFSFEPFYLNASSAKPAKQTQFDKLTF